MFPWLSGQLDYVFLVYGFSFVLMGAVLWGLPRTDSRMPWRWLAMYGLLHGVSEWLDMLDVSLGAATVYPPALFAFKLLGFYFLMEFGRRGLETMGNRVPGRWIIVLLYALAGLGGLAGFNGARAAARYTLVLPGSLAAAWALWQLSCRAKPASGTIRIAAMAVAAYAICAGAIVPKAPFPPASFLNQDSFASLVGIPIQVARGLSAAVLAMAFWWYEASLARQAFLRSQEQASQLQELALASWECTQPACLKTRALLPRRYAWYLPDLVFSASIVVVLAVGWGITQRAGQAKKHEEDQEHRSLAQSSAATMHEDQVACLLASESDLSKPQYAQLKHQLTAMRQAANTVRFHYLMRLSGDKVCFLVDSEPPASKDYSPPGQVYDEISPDLLAAVKNGSSVVVGPYTDRWGTWMTATAPVFSQDGRLLATFATDMDAGPRARGIAWARLMASMVILSVCILLVTLRSAQQASREDGDLIRAGEERLKAAFAGAGIGMSLLDREAHPIQTNTALQRMLGYTHEELAQRVCSDFSHPDDIEPDRTRYAELLKGDRGYYQLEKRLLHKNGRVVWGRKTVTALHDQAGRPQQALVLIEDITERRQVEEHLRMYIADLKRLLEEQQIGIELSAQILQLVNRRAPRHVDLDQRLELFIEAVCVPCKAIGGDHFLVRTLAANAERGSRTVISVKDQSGHEVNCILRSIVSDLIHHAVLTSAASLPLENQLSLLNHQLCGSGLLGEDHFLTTLTVEIDHGTQVMRYAACGHPPLLVIRGDKVLALPQENGPGRNLPVGIIPDASFAAGEWKLEEGDRVLIYTDGLTEMPMGRTGKKIATGELAAMVDGILASTPNASISQIMRSLLREITEASDKQVIPGHPSTADDDVTLMGLEVQSTEPMKELLLAPRNADELAQWIVNLHEILVDVWRGGDYFVGVGQLRLLLEEALTNAWRHGNQRTPGAPIRVRWRNRNDLVIEVIDIGAGFALQPFHDPRMPQNRTQTGGRGIFLMKRICDSLEWKSGGRHLVASLARRMDPREQRRSRMDYLPPPTTGITENKKDSPAVVGEERTATSLPQSLSVVAGQLAAVSGGQRS